MGDKNAICEACGGELFIGMGHPPGDCRETALARRWANAEGKVKALELQIEDLKKTSCSLRHADDLAEERDAALRLIEVVRKNDRLEYLCDCTAKDLGGPHLNGCIVKCILGTSEKRLSGDQKVAGPGISRGETPPMKENPDPATMGDCSSSRRIRAGHDLAERVIDCSSQVPYSVKELALKYQAIEREQSAMEGGLSHCDGPHCSYGSKRTCHCACAKCWDAKTRDV